MSSHALDPLYIGVGGHVVAVDARSGVELWRTELKGFQYITTVHPFGDRLFAGAGGVLFRLDPGSGQILWRNAPPEADAAPGRLLCAGRGPP